MLSNKFMKGFVEVKNRKTILKISAAVVALNLAVCAFSACSSKKSGSSSDKSSTESDSGAASITMPDISDTFDSSHEDKKNPAMKPTVPDKHLTPDVSEVVVEPASASARICATEEECIDALRLFANPNGNEYDALSVLGKFRYTDKTEADMMAKLKSASDEWHSDVKTRVGEKCVVSLSVVEKTPVALTDSKVSDWNSANGKTAEAYCNVKCEISTNYADNVLKISIDVVKTDGSWYVANVSTLNKIRNVIVSELFM